MITIEDVATFGLLILGITCLIVVGVLIIYACFWISGLLSTGLGATGITWWAVTLLFTIICIGIVAKINGD